MVPLRAHLNGTALTSLPQPPLQTCGTACKEPSTVRTHSCWQRFPVGSTSKQWPPGFSRCQSSWHVSRRPLAARGAEPTAINWKTAHGDDLVSRRFLHEPSGSSDKCEPRLKKLPVGSKAYNLGRSLSPKTKTGLSPPACFFPQFCQDSTARDPDVFMGPSIRLEMDNATCNVSKSFFV